LLLYLFKGDYDALTSIHRNLARPITAVCASLLLPILCGCQGHKIIARINGESINDDQYLSRLERVVPQEFDPLVKTNRAGLNIDAGAVALVSILREKAVDLLAKQKNVVPTSETVESIFNYQRQADPNIAAMMKTTPGLEEDIRRNIRIQSEALGIGTDGAQVDAKELNDAFNAQKNSPTASDRLDIPERIGLRVLRVKDADDGLLTLNRLKASGDFAAEAAREGDGPPVDGSERIFPTSEIQKQLPSLYEALKSVKPGTFAPAPLPIINGATSFLAVVEVTHKEPTHIVTLDEVRSVLTQRLLQKKFPQWQLHFIQTLNDFLRKDATIEIDIDRYKPLIQAFFKTLIEPVSAPQTAPPGAVGTPSDRAGSAAPNAGTPPPGSAGTAGTPGKSP
jgi:hypothetical protein